MTPRLRCLKPLITDRGSAKFSDLYLAKNAFLIGLADIVSKDLSVSQWVCYEGSPRTTFRIFVKESSVDEIR